MIRCVVVGLALLSVGCRHNVKSFKFQGCVITRKYVDRQGKERRDCDCTHARQIGIDAKTGASVMRCE